MNSAVYKVYWTQIEGDKPTTMSYPFAHNEMSLALRFMEGLRTRQRANGLIQHVVMSCENPDSVGHPGVDVTGPEYNWKKRRV